MKETVGFIGLGTMGAPMATNLAKAGAPLVVYDADRAASDAVAKLRGVSAAVSAAEVAAKAAVLFTCLPNDDVVRGVYLGSGGVASGGRPGLVTCDCSTVSPEATLAVSAALLPKGIHARLAATGRRGRDLLHRRW